MAVEIDPILWKWECLNCEEINEVDRNYGTVFCEYCDSQATIQEDEDELIKLIKIVDSLFHRFASDYRAEAINALREMKL
jgi:hypothetical protein